METAVLLRIKHFKKRRRRIAFEITAYFVYFVKQKHRIRVTGTLYRIYYTSRHSTYISTTMPAYLSLVMQTAKRNTLI